MKTSDEIREMLQRCDRLPSLSAVALEVLNLIRKDNMSLKELAEIISKDPALVTKVLRTVNSSFYGLSKKVKTIHHATVVLGLSTVKSLALSFTLVKTMSGAKTRHFNYRQFWSHSLTRAAAAKKMAKALAPDLAEEAFVAALLSHIGMLAINVIAAEDYEKVLSSVKFEGGTVAEWEQKILGFTHAGCGAELGRLWHLPETLVLGILHHEDLAGLGDTDERTRQIVQLVHFSNLVSRFFFMPEKSKALKIATEFTQNTWNMDSEQLDLLLNDIHKDVETAAKLFEVAVDDPVSYEQILQSANAELAKLLLTRPQAGEAADDSKASQLQQEQAQLKQRAERLEKLAYHDGLTGLFNLRSLNEHLKNLFTEARLSSRPLGVIFFDIDGFKQVNDTAGHDAANELLCDLTAILTAELRTSDILCRYGGDEFSVLLPNSNPHAVKSVAERLRQAVAGHTFALAGGPVRVTISVGAATYAGGNGYRKGEALLQAADRAMYEAKRGGKNRVCTADKEALSRRR